MTRKKDWRPIFLKALRESANVSHAAKVAQVSRKTVYKNRNERPDFAATWDEAMEASTDTLEAEARRRAYEGVLEPVWYQGEQVGTVRKYSDTLIIFLLKGHRPDRFRERYEHEHKGKVDVGMRIVIGANIERTS